MQGEDALTGARSSGQPVTGAVAGPLAQQAEGVVAEATPSINQHSREGLMPQLDVKNVNAPSAPAATAGQQKSEPERGK